MKLLFQNAGMRCSVTFFRISSTSIYCQWMHCCQHMLSFRWNSLKKVIPGINKRFKEVFWSPLAISVL